MVERRNEPEIVAGSGHLKIRTRFVGPSFYGKLVAIAPIKVVLAEIVDGLTQTPDGFIGAATSIRPLRDRPRARKSLRLAPPPNPLLT
jgi:hypothetical protein